MHFPFITAHSGCMDHPDNSMPSILAALESSADIIEEDIRATKDGEAVLFHDDSITDTSGRCWRISQLTLEQLANLEVIPAHSKGKDGIQVLKLEQLLTMVKKSGKKVNLDLKDYESIGRMAELVRQQGILDQVILTGCETEKAQYVHKHYPEFNLLLNADVTPFSKFSYSDAVDLTCENAKAAGCSGINIHYRLCREDLVKKARESNLFVYVWTVQGLAEMIQMVKMEVHSITTRNLPELIRLKRLFAQGNFN